MPWKSRVWVIGESVFIGCSIVNFAALGLAPASVLVPLESIQFVTNVAYSRIVHKANVPPKMLLGVFLSVVGTVFTVVFGAAGDSCHTLEQLEWAWTSPIWWSYLAVTIGIAVACLRIHKSYEEQLKAGGSPKNHEYVLPITFTLSSALLGGSQMIVQSKVFSELLSMLFREAMFSLLASWLLYVALVLVILCGMIWMIRLTQCLGLYNPLIILPLMVATYILFGGIAGGLYFREFDKLHEGMAGPWGWMFYIIGMLCVLVGLYFIAVSGTASEPEQARLSLVMNDPATFDEPSVPSIQGFVGVGETAVRRRTRSHADSAEVANGARMPGNPAGNPVVLLTAAAGNLSFTVAKKFANSRRGSVGGELNASKSFAPTHSKSFAPKKQARTSCDSMQSRAVSFQPGSGGRTAASPTGGRLSSAALTKPEISLGVIDEPNDAPSNEGPEGTSNERQASNERSSVARASVARASVARASLGGTAASAPAPEEPTVRPGSINKKDSKQLVTDRL